MTEQSIEEIVASARREGRREVFREVADGLERGADHISEYLSHTRFRADQVEGILRILAAGYREDAER